jgi:hypothetical protein
LSAKRLSEKASYGDPQKAGLTDVYQKSTPIAANQSPIRRPALPAIARRSAICQFY